MLKTQAILAGEILLKFQNQKESAVRKHERLKDNPMFMYGYADGWYRHSIRKNYLKSPIYKIGFDAGKADGKQQRLINLLNKGKT